MGKRSIPTTQDIYIEVNGKKVAVVQSAKTRMTKDSKPVEAFGENEPVGYTSGRIQHQIDISRAYATDEAIKDGIDFAELEDFDVVFVKPDHKIAYSGCEWNEIGENYTLNDHIAEDISIIATSRRRENL